MPMGDYLQKQIESLSARRVWIEIVAWHIWNREQWVTLREEGVD